ncbi:Conserved_hypothetical protein [Hexamita inflata]|uniref:Uncharacterized protein n=1 Tax=Hexamita inflata TaxID=28002 RepID=A0AA86NJH0_9EUKA|nr:Conserved hypothetical protein [Hexamita inflata]
MQSSNKLSNELKNSSTNQSGAPKIVDNISEYDKLMIEKCQSKIKNGTLTIYESQDLKSLGFMKFLVIYQLQLTGCKNIIPKLESQIIKWLELTDCEILSVKDFQLDNLEALKLFNMKNKLESKTLIFEIVIFQKLKELSLYRYITDFSTLSQIIGLTKLCLIECNLRSTEALRPLTNLEELNLSDNDEIEITTLQYLTNLTRLALQSCNLVNIDVLRPLVNLEKLYLNSNKDIDITTVQYLTNLTHLSSRCCNLVNIDTLRPLKKLEELEIYCNNIFYFQPLLELKQLLKVDASYNNAIDTESIRLHPNFNNFLLSVKQLPTEVQLKTANKMRDIQIPITSLKQLQLLSNRLKEINIVFRQKITQQLQVSYNSHEQLVDQAALLLQKMNTYDGCQ